MKKDYFKPETQVIEFETSMLMLASSTEIGGGEGTVTPFTNRNESRGEWGNVWK